MQFSGMRLSWAGYVVCEMLEGYFIPLEAFAQVILVTRDQIVPWSKQEQLALKPVEIGLLAPGLRLAPRRSLVCPFTSVAGLSVSDGLLKKRGLFSFPSL